ncbi:translation initiation factor IF-2 associated domain-containing protein [Sphingomonas sp. LR55]|uniref:translation initiation factor IF-2 associated domain-containing protein n=1 Tax=Sphingomonas sp. LR55 TaxID=3050231 RepID=UPI003FA796CA
MRAPLGVKRTVETGQVKQSFSHGRSNTVIVETKRARPAPSGRARRAGRGCRTGCRARPGGCPRSPGTAGACTAACARPRASAAEQSVAAGAPGQAAPRG